VKLAAAGAVTVTFAGWVVMLGVTFTVSVAAALVALPATLETTTSNEAPLSVPAVGFSEYDALVAPEIGAPLRRHWYDKGAVPAATTEKLAAAGAVTVTFAGDVVMLGVTFTVSAATALVTLPATFDTTTVNCAPVSVPAVGVST
jgi:hypothetical protein